MTEKCEKQEKKVYYSFFKKCIVQFDGFVTNKFLTSFLFLSPWHRIGL